MSNYSLRGWKLLPYAVQHLYAPKTGFFRKHEWELFKSCDGQTDIFWDDLSEDDRSHYENWLKGGFIRPAGEGERLMPLQEYRYYNARFKWKDQPLILSFLIVL